jgi:vancomycin resistance protein YoaR
VSATYLKTKSGRVFGVAPGSNGRALDTEATAKAIAAALEDRAAGGAPGPVTVKVSAVAPKLTTEEATKTAPLMTLLGAWSTWFPISDRNAYGANIWLPALTINGTVLQPGQRFEWWSAIGPVTTARGYGLGGIIKSDHTEPTGAMGGGMCSSSTTLFNAALRAGLQMGARSNHKYYIDRYPLGLDATVSKTLGGGVQTMSFTNDMRHPIFIRGIRIGGTSGKGWVRYEIWGVPDGRTVGIGKPVQWNVRRATTMTIPVSSLPHGVRKQTEYPSDGKDVSVTRVVRDGSGRVIHRETYTSHYVLWNGRIEVGL